MNLDLSPELKLPIPNPFLPKDFILHESPTQTLPYKISSENWELWYKPDHTFQVPKCNVCLLFFTPSPPSAREAALQDLFIRLIRDAMNELAYHASMAQLEYCFSLSDMGFLLTF